MRQRGSSWATSTPKPVFPGKGPPLDLQVKPLRIATRKASRPNQPVKFRNRSLVDQPVNDGNEPKADMLVGRGSPRLMTPRPGRSMICLANICGICGPPNWSAKSVCGDVDIQLALARSCKIGGRSQEPQATNVRASVDIADLSFGLAYGKRADVFSLLMMATRWGEPSNARIAGSPFLGLIKRTPSVEVTASRWPKRRDYPDTS